MIDRKKLIVTDTLFVLYLLSVIYLCLMSVDPEEASLLPEFIFGIPTDKLIHFIMFFPLSPLLYLAGKSVVKGGITPFISMITSVAFASIVEYLQQLTGYRSFEIYDLFANWLSILISTLIIKIIINIRKNLLAKSDESL
jgi:VanZ family protein